MAEKSPLHNRIHQVQLLLQKCREELSTASSKAQILDIKSRYVGSRGEISEILKSLKECSPEERRELGNNANTAKREIDEVVQQALATLERQEISNKLEKNWIDSSLRRSNRAYGLDRAGLHPVTIVQRDLERIFEGMGFDILDGPHIEDDWHNFGALNIPSDHPARDMQDTLWFPDGIHLLRTHTSPVQIRGMEAKVPPFRFIVPGKVFRAERTDATHEQVFHQLEGMMVGKDISVAHLNYFMKTMLSELLRKEITIRLRPGYFPFVEPGFELDMYSDELGWVELIGCGMIHPNVLKAGGLDANALSGFAFGMGLDRLTMMKFEISDVRLFHSGDLRFISQFCSL